MSSSNKDTIYSQPNIGQSVMSFNYPKWNPEKICNIIKKTHTSDSPKARI